MVLFYTIFTKFYYFGIWISRFFSSKSSLWLEGRAQIWQQLSSKDIKGCVWFHCASLGEFEQVNYLIQQLKSSRPETKVLVTFFSPSGYEIRKNYPHADIVTYLPYENIADIERFLNIVEPKIVLWVRYEYWYYILKEIHKRQIPLVLLNGVFRPNINGLYKPLLKKMLSFFNSIFVISKSSYTHLKALGFESEVLYDTRYDRMNQVKMESFEDEKIQSFIAHHNVIVCGSTWKEDEDIISEVSKNISNVKWILAPHNINTKTIEYIKSKFPSAAFYSEEVIRPEATFLIIDQIGILSKLYRYADICYVGGGFGKVVHSTLEPLAYSNPIIVGPHIERSEDTKELLALDLIYIVNDSNSLTDTLSRLLTQDDGKTNERKRLFDHRTGSVVKILDYIKKNIDF